MSMKKAIAAALVVGTMTMMVTGSAFAVGPRIHDRYGSSHTLRWEQQKHHGSRHVEIDRHRKLGQNQMKQKGWTRKNWGVRGKSPVFTPRGGGRNPQPGGYRPGGKRPSPRPMGGGRGPRNRGWR